ncbi:hypothetical protein DFH09DRAFT_1475082 [Mycena vulgaris]|nr:hypothetical protein DFH09DRAFT_1475082 [Mycena vulgaris]
MSSPFTSKLGTNYCPSDEEAIAIQTLLVEPTRRLQCLDDEITDLQKAVEKLRDERDKLGAYVDAHMALISPVRRLPLDIIQEIFIACLPAHRNCVMSAVEAPVLLGRICSSWRTISLSTPHLWSKLHVVEPTQPPHFAVFILFDKKVAQRLETTKMWLGRSGQCPLSISVNAIASEAGFAAEIIQALLPFKSRWEHIAFTAKSSVFEALSHLTEVDVPMLKSIHMTEIDDHISFRWDSLQLLRSADILSAYISGGSFTPLELPLSWNGLRDLSIQRGWARDGVALSRDTVLQLFSRCPQLRTCRLQLHGDFENHSSLEEPILELPFLHTLAIECFGTPSTIIPPLFDRLSFPQLRSLTLHGRIGYDDHTLYGPFFAAAPRIESLDLTTELFTKTSLTDFLRGAPHTIREIKINAVEAYSEGPSSILDDQIIELFMPSSEFPTPCCVGLEVLEITKGCYFSDDTLLRLIESRTLKRLIVHFAREMEHDIRPHVRSGLDIELTYFLPSGVLSPWYGLADAPS